MLRRVISFSMRKGKGCGRGWKGAGDSGGKHHSHEPMIPGSEFTVILDTKSHFISHLGCW